MNIKLTLKKYGITLTDFARAIFISRPTLNIYIEEFEDKGTLPDERYSILFNKLFKEAKNKEEFESYMHSYNNLLAKEKILNTYDLPPEKSDMISLIIEAMRRDLKNEESNENIYKFILFIISSYTSLTIFEELANYFLSLNSVIDFNELNKDQQDKVIRIYSLISLYTGTQYNIDYQSWRRKFINRVKEITKEREQTAASISDDLKKRIDEEIKRQIDAGKDVKSINIDDIIKELSKNE